MSEGMMRTNDGVVFTDGQFGKNLACLSMKLAASANRLSSSTNEISFSSVRTNKLFPRRDVRQQLRNSFLPDAQNA
jgi:hypothetical protein